MTDTMMNFVKAIKVQWGISMPFWRIKKNDHWSGPITYKKQRFFADRYPLGVVWSDFGQLIFFTFFAVRSSEPVESGGPGGATDTPSFLALIESKPSSYNDLTLQMAPRIFLTFRSLLDRLLAM